MVCTPILMVVDAPSNVQLGGEEANFNLFGNFGYSPLDTVRQLKMMELFVNSLDGSPFVTLTHHKEGTKKTDRLDSDTFDNWLRVFALRYMKAPLSRGVYSDV